jgi:hypothetical protein
VTRLTLRLAGVALAATAALFLVIEIGVKRRGLAVEVYLDVVCGLVLIDLVAAVRGRLPAARELHRRRVPRPVSKTPRPQQLEWLERQVGDAVDGGYELPFRFRSFVRNIASAALLRRHGVVIDRDPERAEAIVGPRIWELVRPDVRPDDPTIRLPPGGFQALVDDLEAIG